MGTQYATLRTADSAPGTFFRQQYPTMVKIELHNHEPDGDPPAAFATAAEIEIADRLRRKLEARYLAESEASPPLAGVADDDGEEPL